MFRPLFLVLLLLLCTFIYAETQPIVPSLTLLNDDALNRTFPINLILPSQPSLKALPPDPQSRHILNTGITITFRNYTIAISRANANQCVEAALGDLLAHGDRINTEIRFPREYAWGTVELTIVPGSTMVWLEWSYAVKSIQAWLKVYDSVDLNFDVIKSGVGVLGTGRLANVV